jgi:uncharacterized membrane protein YadS
VWRVEGSPASARAKPPWFILGFVLVAALVTWVPALKEPGAVVAQGARRALVTTLFLVGAGVSRSALRQVGVRPLVLGLVLWVAVSAATLAAITWGWLRVSLA